MFRWLRRTFLGLNPREQKVKKLRNRQTFRYNGRGYRVRGGYAYEIDGDDVFELILLMDLLLNDANYHSFDPYWEPPVEESMDNSVHSDETFIGSVGDAGPVGEEGVDGEDTVDIPAPEAEAEVSESSWSAPEPAPAPEPDPTPSYSAPDPTPSYDEPSRSYSSGSSFGGGSSSYDSGGGGGYDSGGGGCDSGGCD